ncbi:hypothetical protein EIP86_009125 [Pleurotus ostreatoroseus]|nr:hypothetical protein EIP86_009125 [Pleurotus ostreatoroseus]
MSKRVRRLIHSLRVGDFTRTAPYGLMHITRREVILILDHLPRLDELKLHELQLLGVEEHIGSDYVPRTLDTLSIQDVVGPSFSATCHLEIIAFIALFCELRYLIVGSFWESYKNATYPATSVDDLLPVILQSSATLPYFLHVEGVLFDQTPFTAPLLQFLRLAGNARNIRNMELACFRLNDLIVMHDFFSEDPSQLESLFLDFIPHAKFMAGVPLKI